MHPKWLFRWRVTGFLIVDGKVEFPYQPKNFILRRNALKYQQQLHKDHGPGMIRTACGRRL